MTKKKVDDDALYEAARELVAGAMAPYERLLTPDERALMRFLLEADLLLDEESRLDLRRALGDPELEQSGKVGMPEVPEATDDHEGEDVG